jgi:hypothetical protein
MVTKRYFELQQKRDELPGWKTLKKIEHFYYSLQIFQKNANELKNILYYVCDHRDGVELVAMSKSAKLEMYLQETGRLIHNWAASAVSLIDHARILYNDEYKSSGLFAEYEDEIKIRFIEDPLSNFVKILRQYCQHYTMLKVGFIINYNNETGMTRKLFLSASDLLEFSGWNGKAKSYISDFGEKIFFQKTVDDYTSHVTNFYKWFHAKQQQIHKSDYDSVAVIQNEMRAETASVIPEILKGNMVSGNKFPDPIEFFLFALEPKELLEISSYSNDRKALVHEALKLINQKVKLDETLVKNVHDFLLSS